MAKMPMPNDSAASAASQKAPDLRCSGAGAGSSGAAPASTTPSATTASSPAEATPRASPTATASTAAMAPSVEVTGVTMPTLPRRSAVYSRSSPAALPRPDTSIHAMSAAPREPGRGPTAITTRFAASPKSITQATTDQAPMMRLERAEQKVPAPHARAAPSPPSRAINRRRFLVPRPRRWAAGPRRTPTRSRPGAAPGDRSGHGRGRRRHRRRRNGWSRRRARSGRPR